MRNLLRAAALALPAVAFAVAVAPAAVADTGHAHRAAGGGHRSVTELGRSATEKAGLSMAFSRTLDGITAACGSAVRRTLPGVRPLPGIPIAPTTDYPVPMHDPSAVILMNKQVKDPFGGAITTGMSLDAAPGTPAAVPRLASGVTSCDAVRRVGESVRLERVREAAPLVRSGPPVTSLVPSLSR
ncbi:MAG: hypothetical protein ACRDOO_03090 [Actinomadura sp.]